MLPETDRLVEQTMWSLLGAGSRVRDRLDAMCAAHDLTYGQFVVLRILGELHPAGCSRGEIARRMIERAPDVTRLLDRLEQRGLAARDRAGDDQRRSLARITPTGHALLDRLRVPYEAILAFVADRVSLRDRQELARICEGLSMDAQ